MTNGSAAMAINSAKVNPFSNFSNVDLADAMGDIDRDLDLIKAREQAARDEMSRRRASSIEGARFTVVKAIVKTHNFDGKAVRIEMGDAWYKARQRDGTRTTYTVTPRSLEQRGVPA